MQKYHSKARTNNTIRLEIQKSNQTERALSKRFIVSRKTVSKWKNRDFQEDKSSRPNIIHYALTEIEKELIRVVRKLSCWSKEALADALKGKIERINPSNVYRTLKGFGISRVPEEKKDEWKKFKEYLPGFIHMDVAYLPVIEGKRQYLFVAIDRATRLIYFKPFDSKTAENAKQFLNECKNFFPFYLQKLLTDNGKEFTAEEFEELSMELGIEHRRTKPNTPKTNGMVEKANDIIKSGTVKFTKYNSTKEIRDDLLKFLRFYNLARVHGGLRREIRRKTPYDALWYWYNIYPNLFHSNPYKFQRTLLSITWRT
jgi:transposase InsO family protein